jgi:hypothetical protein
MTGTGGPTRPSEAARQAARPFAAVSRGIDAAIQGLAALVRFEVVLTVVCACTPFILILGDGGHVRPNISAYYAMAHAQFFYVPLTVAAMLFVVNGVVKAQHWYNVALGVALTGVVLFDTVDTPVIHEICAAAFFLGNAVVFVLYTPKRERWLKVLLAGGVLLGLAGYFLFHWYSLFVAESMSLWVIAVHFGLEAKGVIA